MTDKLIVFLLLLILFCTCDTVKNKIISEKEFTEIYRDSLKKRHPEPVYTIKQDLEIHVKLKDLDLDFIHYLTNAYTSYKKEPDSLAAVLNMYLKSSGDLYKKVDPIQNNKIVPVIKDAGYIDEVATELNKDHRI